MYAIRSYYDIDYPECGNTGFALTANMSFNIPAGKNLELFLIQPEQLPGHVQIGGFVAMTSITLQK